MKPVNLPEKIISPAEARIIAHVCGDGFLCKYRSKRSKGDLNAHPRKNIYRDNYEVGYCNTQKVLLESFSSDVKEVYDLKTQLQKGNLVYFKIKWAFLRLQLFGAGNSRGWFVSDAVRNAKPDIIIAWLQAFFDDEAHVDLERKRICVNSVNENGLKQVQALLKMVGVIHTKFYGPYKYKDCISYRLTIFKESICDYKKEVGFLSPIKTASLKKLIELVKS